MFSHLPDLHHPALLPPGGCLQVSAQLPEGPHHRQTVQDPWGPSITVLTALRLPAVQTGLLLASPGEYILLICYLLGRYKTSLICLSS